MTPTTPALDALREAREVLQVIAANRARHGAIATRALQVCHRIKDALSAPPSAEPPEDAIKAAYQCGWSDREDEIISRATAMGCGPNKDIYCDHEWARVFYEDGSGRCRVCDAEWPADDPEPSEDASERSPAEPEPLTEEE